MIPYIPYISFETKTFQRTTEPEDKQKLIYCIQTKALSQRTDMLVAQLTIFLNGILDSIGKCSYKFIPSLLIVVT